MAFLYLFVVQMREIPELDSGLMDKQTKKKGNTRLKVEAIEEYLLGMYAEGWTEREARNKKLGHAKHIRVFVFSGRHKVPTV